MHTRLHIVYGKTDLRLPRMTCEKGMKITRFTPLETLQQLAMDCQTNSFARCRPKPIEHSSTHKRCGDLLYAVCVQ